MRPLVLYLRNLSTGRRILWCYLICVSSFSALVKDEGFILVFSPSMTENAIALALCAGVFVVTAIARRL